MRSTLSTLTRLMLVCAACAPWVPAIAATTAGATDDNTALQEIVVTATRRDTTIQDTPLSIAVVQEKQLAQMGAVDFQGYFTQVPGVTTKDEGPGDKRYTIRGVEAVGEPQVGLYYDEIPVVGILGEQLDYGSVQPDVRLWDVNRVEVLRGPQGTLYGSGSMGGTIRVISQRPDLHGFDSSVRLTTAVIQSGGNSKDVEGMINVPIVDGRAGLRLTAYDNDDGGWVDEALLHINHANYSKGAGGRANFRFVPVDEWTIDLIAYRQRNRVADISELYPGYSNVAGKWATANYVLAPFKDNFDAENLISEYQLPWATFTVIGSHQFRRVQRVLDTTRLDIYGIFPSITGVTCTEQNFRTCFPPPFNAIAVESDYDNDTASAWSSEVRLASKGSGPFDWTLGWFWQDRHNFHATEVAPPVGNGVTPFVSDGVVANPIYYQTDNLATRQNAIFGEAGYEVVKDLRVSVGARWFKASRGLTQFLEVPFGGLGRQGAYPSTSSSESKTLLRFAVSYKPTADTLLYGQAAQGYRIGGPNLPIGFSAQVPAPYQADSLWDYEIGGKSTWLDRRLTLNGALFYMRWSQIQHNQFDPTGTFAIIVNGGSATIKGVELESNARISTVLDVGAGASFIDATLNNGQPISSVPSAQTTGGDRFPFVPRFTGNLNGTYHFHVATLPAFARLDYSYESGRSTDYDPRSAAYTFIGGWALANFHAGVDTQHYSIALYCNNLGNRRTEESGRIFNGNPLTITSAPPRTFGLQVTLRYQ